MRQALEVRDAFADFAHVPSDELFAGAGREPPFLTIAIPTFRRPDLLAEAVASALDQDFGRPFEVVVVDDDPRSAGHARLLEDLPRIAGANFQYLRNRENIGMTANFSRCLEAARAEWVTILHDDDLIDPGFAREMFAQLAADATIDGLVCRKRVVDRRETCDDATRYREGRGLRRLAHGILRICKFGMKRTRTIGARKLFWACIPGNTVGFLCRTRDARALGGFYPEDYPSADYFFYARFAERFRLCELNKVLATIRLEVNVSSLREINLGSLRRGYALQTAYAGAVLPRYWRRFSPLLMARQLAVTSQVWRTGISRAELGEHLGIEIARDRPLLLLAIRAFLRGF